MALFVVHYLGETLLDRREDAYMVLNLQLFVLVSFDHYESRARMLFTASAAG
jgi:hypothetical protein